MSRNYKKYSFLKYDYFISQKGPNADVVMLSRLRILEDIKIYRPDFFVKFRNIITEISSPTIKNENNLLIEINNIKYEIYNEMQNYQTNILSKKKELSDFYRDTTPFRYSIYGKEFEQQCFDINNTMIYTYFEMGVALRFIDDITEHIKELHEIDELLMETTRQNN